MRSVVHVIDELSPGGAEKMVVLAANGMVGRGYQVSVVTIIQPGELLVRLNPAVQTICLDRAGHFDLSALRKLNSVLRVHDLIHVHLKHTLKYVFLSWLIRPFAKRILLHDHSGDVLFSKRNVYPWVMRWWVSRLCYLGVTPELTAWAARAYRIGKHRTFTLRNVIDDNAAEVLRQPRRTGSDVLKLVLVANFRPIKNASFALKLLHYLKTARSWQVHLTIFGQPVEEGYFASINKLIEDLGLGPSVTIITNEANVTPRLADFHMGLNCSLAETGPLSLLEFMSAGLPFLAIQRGHVADEVAGHRAELILNNFNVEDWADRLEILIPCLTELSIDLRRFYVSNYSSHKYICKLDEIYQSAMT